MENMIDSQRQGHQAGLVLAISPFRVVDAFVP